MKKFEIRKILIPLDFSPTSLKAIDFAKAIVRRTNAQVILLHVMEKINVTTEPFVFSGITFESYENKLQVLSNENLNRIAKMFENKNVDVISSTGRTYNEIIRVSKEQNIDLIIMGTHGVSGFREFIVGSNTFRVVSEAICPVLSVQEKSTTYDFKTILVPFTDMPHSRENVMYAIKVAEIYEASLEVVGVDPENSGTSRKKLLLEAEQIEKFAEGHSLKCNVEVIPGDYKSAVVLDYAKNKSADLIVVIGDSDKQNFAEYFTGSFSQQIINHSSIPVLSIHSKYNPELIQLWHGI
jgi:nucleotide-binding universal stress UspA family protein